MDSRLKAVHYALHHPELLAISGQETLALEPLQQKSDRDLSVLVVDDNTRYRQQITRLIGKICPTSILYEAGSISEAINLGQQIHPQLAFIDVVLEDEDGCRRQVFLGPAAGGVKVVAGGCETIVITPQSPLGRSLLGRVAGDELTSGTGEAAKTYTIVTIR